jgi:hypothetical protein
MGIAFRLDPDLYQAIQSKKGQKTATYWLKYKNTSIIRRLALQ